MTEQTTSRPDEDPARPPSLGEGPSGRREAHRRATAMALRLAALRLFSERGYAATSTADIARAAGVSPRTFFNHFATKEAVARLPGDFLGRTFQAVLAARALGEDPVRSLTAAVAGTFAALGGQPDSPTTQMLRAGLRLAAREPQLRQMTLERREQLEGLAWQSLQDRGVSAEDLAVRLAVTVVIGLSYRALDLWAEEDDPEPLPAVLSRCLLAAPTPARLAAGLFDATPFPPDGQ